MTDTVLTDLGPFFERYDRRQRLVFTAAISVSLTLSAVILSRGVTMVAPPAIREMVWVLGILFAPVFIVGWWTFAEYMARKRRRTSQADGRHPASADDARNGVRIANGGFAFNIVVTAAVVVQQAVMALMASGHLLGDLIPRATCVAVGVVTIYLGNLWPRMPTPRAPEQTAAKLMRAHRSGGWLMVICGLLVVLLGLSMPLLYPVVRELPRP
jgi:hypothetical protein